MKRMLLALMFASPLMAMSSSTALVRTANGYNFHVDGFSREVKPYDVDARVRSMNGEQLGRLAAIGGLKAHKMSNGDYRIEIGGGLKGGGPVAGAVAYWVVKVGLWGGLVGAATTATIATGGAVAGMAVGGAATATAATATAAATAVMSTGAAGAVAGAAAVAGGTQAGILAVTAVTVEAASAGIGVVGGIEAASTGAAALFTLIPFLP